MIQDLDLEGLLERLMADLGSLRDERLIRDKIALEQFLNTYRMSGLPDDIPSGWVSLKGIDEDMGLPADLTMYTDLPTAPGQQSSEQSTCMPRVLWRRSRSLAGSGSLFAQVHA